MSSVIHNTTTNSNKTDPDYYSDQEQTSATNYKGVCSPVSTPHYNRGSSHKLTNKTDPTINSDQEHIPTIDKKGICSPAITPHYNKGLAQTHDRKNIKINTCYTSRLPKAEPTNPKYYSD